MHDAQKGGMKQISSLQNPLIKETLQLLDKSRNRKARNQFVAEGLNELKLCLKAGYHFQHLFFNQDSIGEHELISWFQPFDVADHLIAVSPEVMDKLAYRSGVKNAVAVVASRTMQIADLEKTKNPLFLVAESVEKPGNLGALLRSADAAAATAVIICDPAVDLFNPNVIRSSVGCVFTVPVFAMSLAETIDYLKKEKISIYTTFMQDAENAWDTSLQGPVALVVGTESSGLSDQWIGTGKNINIPMFGKVDSLNVAAAATLLLFEAARQRRGTSRKEGTQ
jgi:TrmH family RNA methyltransferase